MNEMYQAECTPEAVPYQVRAHLHAAGENLDRVRLSVKSRSIDLEPAEARALAQHLHGLAAVALPQPTETAVPPETPDAAPPA